MQIISPINGIQLNKRLHSPCFVTNFCIRKFLGLYRLKKKPVKKVIIEPIELPSVAIVKIRYLLWSEKLIKLIMYISDDPGNNVEDIIDEKNNPESSNNSLIILNYV